MTGDTTPRILLTGAAGRIGTAFYASARGRYWFRLADRLPEIATVDREAGDEAIVLDIASPEACLSACQDVDTVIHLAADPSPAAPYYESLLQNNFNGTYNIFSAAHQAGCRRVIFASSVHAVGNYPQDVPPIPEAAPVMPTSMYGVSKAYGEAVGAYFSAAHQLSSIAIRIGAYDAPWLYDNPRDQDKSIYVSARDLNQLLERCVTTPDISFLIVHGSSDNRTKRLSIEETRARLGYQPLDDGFSVLP